MAKRTYTLTQEQLDLLFRQLERIEDCINESSAHYKCKEQILLDTHFVKESIIGKLKINEE